MEDGLLFLLFHTDQYLGVIVHTAFIFSDGKKG